MPNTRDRGTQRTLRILSASNLEPSEISISDGVIGCEAHRASPNKLTFFIIPMPVSADLVHHVPDAAV